MTLSICCEVSLAVPWASESSPMIRRTSGSGAASRTNPGYSAKRRAGFPASRSPTSVAHPRRVAEDCRNSCAMLKQRCYGYLTGFGIGINSPVRFYEVNSQIPGRFWPPTQKCTVPDFHLGQPPRRDVGVDPQLQDQGWGGEILVQTGCPDRPIRGAAWRARGTVVCMNYPGCCYRVS
jgi:hypothetical protein